MFSLLSSSLYDLINIDFNEGVLFMNFTKEAISELMNVGLEEKEAKSMVSWYQASAFLIPSNLLSLILALIGIDLPSSLYFLMAVLLLIFSPKYILKNISNIDRLRSNLKVLKPLCIIVLVLWGISVCLTIFGVFLLLA